MHRFSLALLGASFAVGLSACVGKSDSSATSIPVIDTSSLSLSSPDFGAGEAMPLEFTCDGGDFGSGANPELDWKPGPDGTKSYALVLKDISITARMDATTLSHGYHWAIWNIPSTTTAVPHDLSDAEFPPEVAGARQWAIRDQFGYFPPCPNSDPTVAAADEVTDTYTFALYAIPTETLKDPAYDAATPNYVETLDAYLKTVAIKAGELLFTSDAASASAPAPLDPSTVEPPSTSN
ncbi:MAG TPA: YbhB/YbcL family Raf kinase inhibitor-like protein [Polyangiaceae bacterium]|nr:YbhB/YbcL family Raf kinase inhibitor-like protein [Polyangiaceae bacterium]